MVEQKLASELKGGEYSFQPQLQTNYISAKMKERSTADKAYLDLYTVKKNKDDVKTEDVEYERNKKELTFTPNIKKSQNTVTKK